MKKIIVLTLGSCLIGVLLLLYFFFKDLKVVDLKTVKTNSLKGIDVSHHNQIENWNTIKDSLDFIIIKATEGATFKDPQFKNYWNSAKRHGLVRGAYHFFVPNVSAEKQFDNFKNSVNLSKGDLIPFLDVEDKNVNISEVNKWLDLAKKHYGVQPVIYSEYTFFKFFLNGKVNAESLWIYVDQKYDRQPTFKKYNCVFWQYSHQGNLPGIKGDVDLDMFIDSVNTFSNYLIKKDI
jgi:lysozyme